LSLPTDCAISYYSTIGIVYEMGGGLANSFWMCGSAEAGKCEQIWEEQRYLAVFEDIVAT